MSYEIVGEGFISQRQKGTPTGFASGPRCVTRGRGEILCSFMAQGALGHNDFKPMLARSSDNGATWSEAGLIWPAIQDQVSIFGSVSAAPNGDLYYYGMFTPIDRVGESAVSEVTGGLKQNDLGWTRSRDFGRTWEPFQTIPMPIPGSAEAPGPICATRRGDLVCCYSPYANFDPNLKVETNQVISLTSRDEGRTWSHRPMLRLPEPTANGAEAWVVELADGRLLGTGWHVFGSESRSNVYALSRDGGATWSPTRPTGTLGQSTGLAALPDGRSLFVYNQRKHGTVGVWLAVVRPTEEDFGLLSNEPAWRAEVAVQGSGAADYTNWTSFAFGEPSVTPLHDGTLLVAFWVAQPSGHGIRYVKLRLP